MLPAVLAQVAAATGALLLVAWLRGLARRRAERPVGDGERPAAVPLVPLRTSYTAGEAEIIRGLLQSHGVPAVVSTDDAGGWRPEGLWRPERVLVRADDLVRAQAVLAEARDGAD